MPESNARSVHIAKLDVFAYRVPVKTPVMTSFGVMHNRPAVFVRLESTDGAFGWGEIFANWPAAGAEHRARLLIEDIADLFVGKAFDSPVALFESLERGVHTRALQSGEWGPFRQVIAGVDTAANDLVARRAGVPLRKLLNPGAADRVKAYASGINPTAAVASIQSARARGFNAFKVKIGFDFDRDVQVLQQCAATLQVGELLNADANQAWDVETASRFADAIDGLRLGWLEEPIGADAPDSDWQQLAAATKVPLAAGENIVGMKDFTDAMASGVFSFVQPDVAKWGGITRCYDVGRAVLDAGRTYCPHFLGGGIGLHASAQLLAAVGGPGMLEVDINTNPLRDAFGAIDEHIKDGMWILNSAPGLGIESLPEEIAEFQTLSLTRSAA